MVTLDFTSKFKLAMDNSAIKCPSIANGHQTYFNLVGIVGIKNCVLNKLQPNVVSILGLLLIFVCYQ